MSDDCTRSLTVISGAVSTILAADTNDILGKLAQEIANFTPDATTESGRKAIASMAHRVATTKMDLIRLGKGLTEGWRSQTKAVNAECNILEERMDALKEDVRAPLTAYENREKRRVDWHNAALAVIRDIDPALERASANDISLAIAARMEPAARDWEEFRERAVHEYEVSMRTLRQWREAAEDREETARENAIEAARQQAEREEQIRSEAAAKAKAEAEAAAKEARLAEEERRVEAARQEMEQRRLEILEAEERERHANEQRALALRDAEAARAEGKRQAEQAWWAGTKAAEERAAEEIRRADAETKAREENIAHQRRIHNDVRQALVKILSLHMDSVDAAKLLAARLVIEIARLEVPHVTIKY